MYIFQYKNFDIVLKRFEFKKENRGNVNLNVVIAF